MDVVVQIEKLDRVLVDRSAGQHENGWWVVAANYPSDGGRDEGLFFLSEDGTLYGQDGNRSWTTAIGYQPGLREADAMLGDELVPIPGRPGWRKDDQGREWYSDAWLDGVQS